MYDLRHDQESSTKRPNFSQEFTEETKKQRHTGPWIAIAVLAAATAGLCWYSYPALSRMPATLAQFPVLQKSIEGMNARLSETEARLKSWGGSQQELEAQLAKLRIEMMSRLRAASKQARDLNADLYKRVHAEMATQTQGIETKIAQVESASEAGRATVDKLEAEVTTLRQQAAQQADELRNVRSELDRAGATRDQQLASLNQQLGRATRDVEGLSRKLAVKRVDFEVTRNHSQQLTEEVSLGVTGTDVSHRRISGWMWLMPDRRTIWLRGQGAGQPVVFYGYQDGKRREMVITNVAKDSVTGYLLLPVDGDTSMTASVSKGE